MKINQLKAREIISSSGFLTLACDIFLENNMQVSASIPSNFFFLKFKNIFSDEKEKERRRTLKKAIDIVDNVIAPLFIGREPDLFVLDVILSDLRKTFEVALLETHITLLVSITVCKAQALVEELEVFELIAQMHDACSVSLPFPLITVAHSLLHNVFGGLQIVPVGAQNFRLSVDMSLDVIYAYQDYIQKNKKNIFYIENQIACFYNDIEESFNVITNILKDFNYQDMFVFSFDAQADYLYNAHSQKYLFQNGQKNRDEVIEIYQNMIQKYSIYSFKNSFSCDDLLGLEIFFKKYNNIVQISMDAKVIQNTSFAIDSVKKDYPVNAVSINILEASTVSDLIDIVGHCQIHGLNIIMSTCYGETEDTFLSDFSVGVSAGQLYSNHIFGSEYAAKYNRLFAIEDFLAHQLLK